MKPLTERTAAVARQRDQIVEQAERAAASAEALLTWPGVTDEQRAQLEAVATKFRAVRAILHPIPLNSLVPTIEADADHDPIA